MFVNFSNHASKKWDKKQFEAGVVMSGDGQIVDIPFPAVAPTWSKKAVDAEARMCVDKIMDYAPKAVMCQGEFTLSYSVINMLKERGVKVVAACSNRMVNEQPGGTKIVEFKFEQFREY